MSTRENPEKVVIFGSGPAGLTAALYTSRADLEPIVYEGLQPGGQLTITTDVDNYPGFPEGIMGPELMERFKAQVTRFGTRFSFEGVEEVKLDEWPFYYKAGREEGYAKTIIIASGASAKYLGIPNEERFQLNGGGVSACATCDGFFYRGLEVAVVGGGDSAVEEASFLTKFATNVHLLVRRDQLRASKIMQKRAFENEKIQIHWNTEALELLGDDKLTGARILNNVTNEESILPIQGFFLGIGHKPNSDPFKKWVEMDDVGYIQTQADSTATNIPGVFACGDVQDSIYRQAVTAAGSGCMAAIEAERWLEAHESGE